MDWSAAIFGLAGGVLIGLAAGAFLIINGRIAGISGILGGLLRPVRRDVPWRLAFVGGLVAGGALVAALYPEAFPETVERSTGGLLAAGLLVGFGTRLGSGCTSGHGVCGVGRLAPRSMVASAVFVAFALLTTYVVRHVLGGV